MYLRAIDQVRESGGGAILLVPEIALTPQLVGRFRARFGDDIAVLHSGLTARQREDAWQSLQDRGRAYREGVLEQVATGGVDAAEGIERLDAARSLQKTLVEDFDFRAGAVCLAVAFGALLVVLFKRFLPLGHCLVGSRHVLHGSLFGGARLFQRGLDLGQRLLLAVVGHPAIPTDVRNELPTMAKSVDFHILFQNGRFLMRDLGSAEVERIMLEPIAGEITDREPHNGYLVFQGGIPEEIGRAHV